MASYLDEIRVIIDARTAREAEGDVNKFKNAIQSTTEQLGKMVAGFIGIRQGFRFIKESVRLAEEQEISNRKLASTIEATGNQLQFAREEYLLFAEALSKKTGIKDDIISTKAISNLLTFKNINLPDIFARATKAAMDLSATFDQDLKNSAIQIGKALADPTVGITALRRIGVTFTEEERKIISGLVEVGKLAEAQRTILTAIEGQVGNAAENMSTALQKAIKDWKELTETIGTGFLPAINNLLKPLSKFVEISENANTSMRDAFTINEEYAKVSTERIQDIVKNRKELLQTYTEEGLQISKAIDAQKQSFSELNIVNKVLNAGLYELSEIKLANKASDINDVVVGMEHENKILEQIISNRQKEQAQIAMAQSLIDSNNIVARMLDQELAIEDVNMALEDTAAIIQEKITPTTIKMTEGWVTNLGVLSTEWKDFVESSMQLNLDFMNGWDSLGDSMVSSFKNTINRLLNEFITSGLLTLIMSIMTPGSGVVSGGGLFGGLFTNLFGGGGGGTSMSIGGGNGSVDFSGTNQRLDRIINVLSNNTGQGMNPLQLSRVGQTGSQMRSIL